jgi:hypothetical protein
MSPSAMDQALTAPSTRTIVPEVVITNNDDNPDALAIAKYKGEVSERFAGNWEQFFIQWRSAQELTLDGIQQQNQELALQNEQLYKQNIELSHQIDYLVGREKEKNWLRNKPCYVNRRE